MLLHYYHDILLYDCSTRCETQSLPATSTTQTAAAATVTSPTIITRSDSKSVSTANVTSPTTPSTASLSSLPVTMAPIVNTPNATSSNNNNNGGSMMVSQSDMDEWKRVEREKIRREIEARCLQEAEYREGLRLADEERERQKRAHGHSHSHQSNSGATLTANNGSNDIITTNNQGRLWRAAFTEFLTTCDEQCRIIIDELSLPYHSKSIRATHPTGTRFIIKNINLYLVSDAVAQADILRSLITPNHFVRCLIHPNIATLVPLICAIEYK
jgi:hypothetical protein